MSQLPKNLEKILLGVGGVTALACVGLGVMKTSAVDADFVRSVPSSGKEEIEVPEAPEAAKAVSSLTSNREIIKQEHDGSQVDTFVGIALFADKNDLNRSVDPRKGTPVHEGIPNSWWLDNGANMTFANSPDRDDDGDGFTNREEFLAKTHPVDATKYPPLVTKLAYVKDESTMWYVQFGLESGGKWAPRFVALTPDKSKKLQNRVSAAEMLAVGDTFFKEGDFANRFKFVGIEEREVKSERTGLAQNVKIGIFEELKANKAGDKYESQAGLPDAELESKAYYDRIAVLDLRAIGYGGKEFKVEERTKFALPPDAPEKNYLLKKVTPTGIEVEYTDASGATQTREIPKG
ncbi:hypothetical protein OKA04_15500 [Luteolibacter flavescens]|uniref:Uncharacterized protein n=1 Tax=Luteolibacter flavescens TaxID=1859460 RepID=A0ABT3FRG8_9BACT|nr:Amuc_1099 family pilus-like system protein [Luteolibacter flavescens]MCW1886142.1 hypothetical protein [Luteolibacter flavescens]